MATPSPLTLSSPHIVVFCTHRLVQAIAPYSITAQQQNPAGGDADAGEDGQEAMPSSARRSASAGTLRGVSPSRGLLMAVITLGRGHSDRGGGKSAEYRGRIIMGYSAER